MLAAAGLGEDRVLRELDARLKETRTVVSKHGEVDSPDGSTRMRATELLAELNRMRKSEVAISSDAIEIVPPPKPEVQPDDAD